MSLFENIRYRLFWQWVILTFFLDQITKWLAECFLVEPLTLISGWLQLQCVHNSGAAWSLLSGQRLLLIAFALLALGCFAYFRKELELQKRSYQRIFGLMIGGICGNLSDRIIRGFVVDFIDVTLPFYRWPSFNVADIAICGSVALYLWFSFKKR